MYCLRQFSESRLVFSFFHISALLAFVAHFSLSVSFVHFLSVFSFRIRDVPPYSLVFSYAAAGLRQFSESRLLLSFFRERKEPHSRPLAGMSKAIPGRRSSSPEAAPPPARSSGIPASVIRCLCTAPEMRCCDIAYDAALTRRPSQWGRRCLSSALRV